MIEFTVTPEFADYSAANRLVRYEKWSFPRIARSAAIMTLAVSIAITSIRMSKGATWQEELPTSLAFGLGAAAFWLLFCFGIGELQLSKAIRKAYDQIGTVSLPTRYRFTDEGMQAEYEEGNSHHGWNRIIDFLLDRRVLMLRRTDAMFFLIPVSQVAPDQLSELFGLLERVGIKRG